MTDHNTDNINLDEILAEYDLTPEQPMFADPLKYWFKCPELEKAYEDGKFVTQTEFPKRTYMVFDSPEHYFHYSQSLPEHQRCFHEVIIGDTPRNLYVDIDGNDIAPDQYPILGNEVIKAFIQSVYDYWGVLVTYDDLCVISACGYSKIKDYNKFSLHLRVPTLSATPREMAEFAKFYSQRLSKPDLVDIGVYKTFQLIRTLGSTKLGDERPSHILRRKVGTPEVHNLHPLEELRSTLLGWKPAISVFTPKEKLQAKTPAQAIVATNATIKWILDHTTEHYEGYRYRNCRGSHIYFKRVNPPKCDICDREHDSDNALFMTVHADHVTKSCHRDPQHRHVKILDLQPDQQTPVQIPPPEPAPPKKTSADRLRDVIAEPLKPYKLNTDLFNNFTLDEYCEATMRPYIPHAKAATVIIQAQKKLGKTETLVKMIKDCFFGKTIIALSHRKTFAGELCRQLPDFVNYEDIKGRIDPLTHPRVIVQVESMNKIDLNELRYHGYPVDLLIMDESESIIEQLGSGLDKNFAASWDNFNWLTLYAQHVIAIDANVTNRTLSLLADREANEDFNTDQCVMIRNTYKQRDFEYKFTTDGAHWRARLDQDIANGLHIVIPINSAKEAKALYKDISAKYPDVAVGLYTGDTDQAVKLADIADINNKWAGYQILIYTPTITSGVGFKLDNYDIIYAWFNHLSCSVLACDQMLGRVRSISTNTAIVYVSPDCSENRLSAGKIRNSMLTSRNKLYAGFGTKWLSYETTPEGIKIHNERYFNICVQNTAAMNKTRSEFMGEFIRVIKRTGAKVSELEAAAPAPAVEERHAMSKDEVRQEEIQQVVDTPDITEAEFAALSAKAEKTTKENAKLHRAHLRRAYDFAGEIDAKFVEVYDDQQQKTWYKNLNAIKNKSLAEIQAEERAHHEQYSAKASNWNKTYHFEHHRIAQSILYALGFTGIDDTTTRSVAEITTAINAHKAEWVAQHDHVCGTLHLRMKKPTFADVRYSIRYLKAIVHSVYGVTLSADGRCKKGASGYHLEHQHAFDKRTYQPIVRVEETQQEKKEDLTTQDIESIDDFINSL